MWECHDRRLRHNTDAHAVTTYPIHTRTGNACSAFSSLVLVRAHLRAIEIDRLEDLFEDLFSGAGPGNRENFSNVSGAIRCYPLSGTVDRFRIDYAANVIFTDSADFCAGP